MNWGNKLVIVFLAFGTLMIYMVTRCIQTPVNLVTKEYYKDELAYQEVIDGTNKANKLSSQVSISQYAEYITLQLPQEMNNKSLTGNVWFYCPASSKKDKRFILKVDNQGLQRISKDAFMPGRYTVKFRWENGEDAYYSEQSLNIQ